jgi:hypothetical protein
MIRIVSCGIGLRRDDHSEYVARTIQRDHASPAFQQVCPGGSVSILEHSLELATGLRTDRDVCNEIICAMAGSLS